MVNREYFIEVARKGVPKMHPLSLEYRQWWKEQLHRCKYGYRVGGVYMPGRLYFYVNFWNIELNKGNSKRKSIGIPELRDVEWEFADIIEKARGFSGFDENGLPLYEDPIKGIMIIAGRGSGKSYSMAGMGIGYEYTFFPNTELVVSAGETKYSVPHMQKVKFGLDNLPGDTQVSNTFFPSPFKHQRIKDNWQGEVRSGYTEKVGNSWVEKGYNSRILHRVYENNPTACNGLRPVVQVMEEIGMFPNLTESFNNTVECWMNGAEQFGTPILIGTGGDMERGTVDASKMFFDPDAYNIVSFDDLYEQRGKIGFFLPAWKGLNQFKDSNGFTDREAAVEYLERRREEKRRASDKRAYYSELQNQPLKPSEAFLRKTGNMFPTADLQEQLARVTTDEKLKNLGQTGVLTINPSTAKVEFRQADLVPADFPPSDESEGCVVIWEHPKENAPFGLYIAGIDPYDQDKADSSPSLGSCFIYKRFFNAGETYNILVAEYTGRPATANEFYETVRRLLIYYNAKALYENQLKGLKQYFEMKQSLHLLKEQPKILKEIAPTSKVERGYGLHMSKEIKAYGERLINQWLLEERGDGVMNLHTIYSPALLKELIVYNDEGNFDRVIALMMSLIHSLELHKVVVEKEEMEISDAFFSKKLFTRH